MSAPVAILTIVHLLDLLVKWTRIAAHQFNHPSRQVSIYLVKLTFLFVSFFVLTRKVA